MTTLEQELMKLDRVEILALKKQMEVAVWLWSILDKTSAIDDLCEKMGIKTDELEAFKRGAKDFTLRQIAGMEAVDSAIREGRYDGNDKK